MSEYYIDDGVTVGDNVTIEPFAVIKGNTILRDGCVVGSFSYLENAEIGANTVVKASRITDSSVGADCSVGPNAHVRERAIIGNNCRIGNFVEIKKSVLGDNVKASHLSYVGDAFVGPNTNIGCGVIFVNYDGTTKHKTTVGKNCFIGCNSNLVAPLYVGDDCFIACGTTVDKDVPDGSFGIGRSYLTVKEGKAKKYLKGGKTLQKDKE
ncbi:MAG: hypothetical protein NC099_01460 [Corallococcus sp.]|nr:hypothetical protein [Corallococcus sp.]